MFTDKLPLSDLRKRLDRDSSLMHLDAGVPRSINDGLLAARNVANLNVGQARLIAPMPVDIIHVAVAADKNTLIGLIATVNSVQKNTKSHVKFHLITEKHALDDLR